MNIINDSDTREYKDASGDTLVLLVAPRQRDVERCDEVEREEAIAAFNMVKELGIDTDKAMSEAQEDPEKMAVAQAAADARPDGPKVRAFRLKALAISMVVSGNTLGGQAITEAYGNMDPASARWVNAQVSSVWESALPSDEEAKTPGA